LTTHGYLFLTSLIKDRCGPDCGKSPAHASLWSKTSIGSAL
jgi:hypothetical protein